MKSANKLMEEFISRQLQSAPKPLLEKSNLEDDIWDCSSWAPTRSGGYKLSFAGLERLKGFSCSQAPSTTYRFFMKAHILWFQESTGSGFSALNARIITLKRLWTTLSNQGYDSPVNLENCHFQEVYSKLKAIDYANLYDAINDLKKVAESLDKACMTYTPISFSHNEKPAASRHSTKAIKKKNLATDQAREYAEKILSASAIQAYAQASNTPENVYEELGLRIIDILFATGLRGGEVTYIPYDCWIEKEIIDGSGRAVKNNETGALELQFGIRYFPEKGSETRVHWLDSIAAPLASRAILRLQELTAPFRKTLTMQSAQCGRPLVFWNRDEVIFTTDFMMKAWIPGSNFHGASGQKRNTKLFLTKTIGCKPIREKINRWGLIDEVWRVADIEDCIIRKYGSIETSIKLSSSGKVVDIDKSDFLILVPDGAFNFEHAAKQMFNINLVSVSLLNKLLGAPGYEKQSIFARRGLTEKDGSPMRLTTHLPRHWRNMLLDLMGLSNIQQALAMGRRDIGQNRTYQHPTLYEKTQLQREYFDFVDAEDKARHLREGIESGNIIGGLSDLFEELKENHGKETAQEFLDAHAKAMHIVPGGVCTRDFDLSPCPKFLKCLDGCGNLHLLGAERERAQIAEMHRVSKAQLVKMTEAYGDDPRYKEGIERQRIKVTAIEENLKKSTQGYPQQAFPSGKRFNEENDTSQNHEIF